MGHKSGIFFKSSSITQVVCFIGNTPKGEIFRVFPIFQTPGISSYRIFFFFPTLFFTDEDRRLSAWLGDRPLQGYINLQIN